MSAVAAYTDAAQQQPGTVDFLLNIIPDTIVGAFARGDVLQVLLFAVLFGLALLQIGDRAAPLVELIAHGVRRAVRARRHDHAAGADRRVRRDGVHGRALRHRHRCVSLGQLMAGVYLTCAAVRLRRARRRSPRRTGFSLVKFLRYIGEEILIVLGTSSSESALPRIMAKLEYLGCSKPVVGLVVPTGYSFNLDGTAIYMTMAAMFVAQASGVDLSLGQQLGMLARAAASPRRARRQ